MKKNLLLFLVLVVMLIGISSSLRSEDPEIWGYCTAGDNPCIAICPSCGTTFMDLEGRVGRAVIVRCGICGYSED